MDSIGLEKNPGTTERLISTGSLRGSDGVMRSILG